ncbi:MAG: ABC transporter ATP-binding protein [Paludibacteraceae bacterium]|nr:ABC transporter ATP-binding protein [Paludibacteraceae bacterium]
MSNVSISTNKLTIGYRATSGDEHVVQTDLSFSLRAGEMVCMLGPNGCGKSTLLRTLAGLQPALSGEYTHCDTKHIALVLTERLSMDNTTVHDVVAMGRYPYTSFLGGLTETDEAIIAESLRQVGFENRESKIENSFFNAHSDGEKQRILIAKALAQQTPIILLDEPTAHLDLPHRILILRLLRNLAHEQSKTVLISTHELDLALALSDRILLMTPGHGIQLDTAANLKKTDAFTSAFGMDIFDLQTNL